jgi:serine/threonine-protein kinase ULK/ATG1
MSTEPRKRREVGDYWIDRKIGSGTYAKVYKCTHKATNDVYAMKVIDKKKISGKNLQANLELEISIMARFRHNNLVRLHHTMRGPKNIFLVMEYCGGGDLASAISKHAPLPENVVEPLMAQLACGLEFLWSKNLVHRDIKPQNILMTGGLDSTLKLADFGFARYLGAAHLAETACGSPLYMAPEVLRRDGYNNKADLWSVGCVLFEMLTKLTPFTAYNEVELLRNVEANKIAKVPKGVRVSSECKTTHFWAICNFLLLFSF